MWNGCTEYGMRDQTTDRMARLGCQICMHLGPVLGSLAGIYITFGTVLRTCSSFNDDVRRAEGNDGLGCELPSSRRRRLLRYIPSKIFFQSLQSHRTGLSCSQINMLQMVSFLLDLFCRISSLHVVVLDVISGGCLDNTIMERKQTAETSACPRPWN